MRQLFTRAPAHHLGEIHAARGGDVGNGEAIAGDPGAVCKFGIEPGRHTHGLALVVCGHFSVLIALDRAQHRIAVAHPHHQRHGEQKLHAPVPHFDEGAPEGVASHKVRLGLQRFEIGANGPALGQRAAVIEFERRDLAERAFRAELVGPMLALLQIERDNLDVGDVFLGQEHHHPARVGRIRRDIELHRASPQRSATPSAPP